MDVDAVAMVRVKTDPDGIHLAATAAPKTATNQEFTPTQAEQE